MKPNPESNECQRWRTPREKIAAHRLSAPPTATLPGTAALLPLADLIQGYARRLENLGTWRDRLTRQGGAVNAGEQTHRADDLLRLQQALRIAGRANPDEAFFMIAWLAEGYAEDLFLTDPQPKELSARLKAIEQREGLTEFEEFDPDSPDTPSDWKALSTQLQRRYEDIAKIEEDRMVHFLRSHGETDMADLYANDRDAYDRRREAGRFFVFGAIPHEDIARTEGDTPLTQEATEVA